MSAPREKKQRLVEEPEEKVLTPEEREAAAKRTSKRYAIIAIVIAVLVAALLFWDSGTIQRNTAAITIGDTDYSAAEVSYYYHLNMQETMTYAQYGMNGYNLNLPPEDQLYYADPMSDVIMSWADYFEELAIEQLTDLTACYDAAIKAGYSDEDVREDVDIKIRVFEENATASGYESLAQMLSATAGRLVTPKVYRDIVTRNSVANLYIDEYTAGLEYTEEDLNVYYEEHADELDTVEYGYIYFRAEDVEETDADGNKLDSNILDLLKESALNEARYKASEVAAEWAAIPAAERADAIPELIEKYSPSSSTSLTANTSASMSSVVAEWLLADERTPDELGLVDLPDYGTYVILFHDRYLEATPSVNVQHLLVRAEIDEGATSPTDEQMAAAKAEAEELLAQWKAGAATEESFAALAEEHSDDGRNEDGTLYTPGGKYTHVYEGNFVTDFNNWLFHDGTRQAGDTGIVENDGVSGYYGYHAVHFLGHNENDFEWKSTAKSTLVEEALSLHRSELASSYTITEKAGMKNIY